MGYIDPNLFGILSQLGLGLVLVVGVVFTFFRTSIQRLFGIKPKNQNSDKNDPNEKK